MQDSVTFAGEPNTWRHNVSMEDETIKAQPRGSGGNGGHKVNMVEVKSNSFRLDSSLSNCRLYHFLLRLVDSGVNIHVCIGRS